jgi:glycosyltransferase involved in cell wall biosynthesis
MPTANRRSFVPRAIRYFLAQDYTNRELVILDDGSDGVADLVPQDPRVRYARLSGQRTLGAKRNACVAAARGELIMHWDDDDWMAPWRISYQVSELHRAGAEACGLRRMLFYEPVSRQAWLYDYPENQRAWLAGGSLLYRRTFWERAPFPDLQVGSDTYFVWSQPLDRTVALPDFSFYVALVHAGNTSPKERGGPYWSAWTTDLRAIMGDDLDSFDARAAEPLPPPEPPACDILMVAHNACEVTQLATLRTLRHSCTTRARLVVVDSASDDGTQEWLGLLAQRGDIDLIRCETNIGHGAGLELARQRTCSPYIVTLDSDAFPVSDDWLPCLRQRLQDPVRAVGIRHHRDYIHPSCLMMARNTLDDLGVTFLAEKDGPSRFDVAERISHELKQRGFRIAGLQRTSARRRGSASEPVYLGATYEGLVYHQWYTTRAATARGGPVDDVPKEALDSALRGLLDDEFAEPRELTVVTGVRATPGEPDRKRNAEACLRALNLQNLERWRYRIVVVEQDRSRRLEQALAPLADRYIFVPNSGAYNRGWAFNIGAHSGARDQGALCLIDADLLVPPDFLRHGLERLQQGALALQPYNEIVYLDQTSSERAIAARLARPLQPLQTGAYSGRVFDTSQGGCIWVDAALYARIGGHDERFRGWGREDREFWDRLSRETPIASMPDRLLHLYHPPPAMEDSAATANARLHDDILAGRAPATQQLIGNPMRYSDETRLGSREWENWHSWSAERIDRIVADERVRSTRVTARHQLADLAAGLADNNLLDVGCGPGAMWPYLEAHRPRLTWTGVDSTLAMVEAARRLFPGVAVYHADAGTLPFADRSFDVVLLRHVLEHLPAWLMVKALAEATRVARQAVVLDFFLPPNPAFGRSIRVGENFLQTMWTVAELEAPIASGGWHVQRRFELNGGGGESDEVWLLGPNHSETHVPSSAGCAATEPASATDSLMFSIVMPTYHRNHTIRRTVDTIRAQTHRNWELIIVDNSGDLDYQFDDPRIHVYVYTARTSASYARNQGLRHARGELVCFFDDDDDMFPTYLARLARAFVEHPHARMVRCGMLVDATTVNFSYATPECCLRAEFATPSWDDAGWAQDQRYFGSIVSTNDWSEARGDIVVVREALCRANEDSRGGLRSGHL